MYKLVTSIVCSAVTNLGLDPNEVTELRAAIEADDQSTDAGADKPGSRVKQFLAKFSLGTVRASGHVANGALGNVVGQLVNAYYGIT